MASRRQSPTPKRTLALKRADGEPLTRADIQFDFLHAIFEDSTCAFGDPYLPPSDKAEGNKLCFRDLYVKAIMNSPKATKALKDKMIESTVFAQDFAMLSLLVNVGRINTTMSFFPEMKTAIRTYHPIPALQRTSGNLQDAPRIKHILKTGILEIEAPNAPATPADILAHAKAGQQPSTSVLNLMFVMASHSGTIGLHLSNSLDFLDLFLRNDISSSSRAQAFLWLCYNYLENPAIDNDDDYDAEEMPNPFADRRKNTVPVFISLSPEEIAQENVDSEDEKALAEKLVAQRDQITKLHAAKESGKDSMKASVSESVALNDEEEQVHSAGEVQNSKGKRKAARNGDRTKRTTAAKEKKAAADRSRRERLKRKTKVANQQDNRDEDDDEEARNKTNNYSPFPSASDVVADSQIPAMQQTHQRSPALAMEPSDVPPPIYRVLSSANADSRHGHSRHRRYSPYRQNPNSAIQKARSLRHVQSLPERTMLQHAWHVVTATDPLMDSDDEHGNEHDRHDYIQRLKVVSRLSRKQWNEPQPPSLQLTVDIPQVLAT